MVGQHLPDLIAKGHHVSTSLLGAKFGGVPGVTALCRPCGNCRTLVVHLRTYLDGRKLVFDAEQITVTRGDAYGWIAGDFRIRDRTQRVLAPIFEHPWANRRFVRLAYRLHDCRVAA